MAKELILAFETAADKFYEAFSIFSKEEINTIPFDKSWTPAQVVDHIVKSQSGIPQLFAGETKEADRDPEEKKEIFKKIFLDFSTKLQSPDFILPTTLPQDKDELLTSIKEKKEAIIAAMKVNDLKRICTGRSLPSLGELTGLEWIWFATYHVQRHTHQLEKMYTGIKNAVSES